MMSTYFINLFSPLFKIYLIIVLRMIFRLFSLMRYLIEILKHLKIKFGICTLLLAEMVLSESIDLSLSVLSYS